MTRCNVVRCILILVFLVVPVLTHAQMSLFFEQQLSLRVMPEYPRPGETVQLSLDTSAIDLDRSEIIWILNGRELARGPGVKEASFVAGTAGSVSVVEVVASTEDTVTRTRVRIRPASLDLIWNTDSYTPPFYRGRALAGTQTTIRAYALATFQQNGTSLPEREIVYTWKRNDTVLNNVSGRGRSSAVIEGPNLYDSLSITVEAESVDRTWKQAATVQVANVDPFVLLYENHPLFGVLFHRSIEGEVHTEESEQKVTAVPFFAHAQSPADPRLTYEWIVNGEPISADPKEPQTLTLTAQGYSGPADVSLILSDSLDILLHARGTWRLLFGGESNAFLNTNVFGQ
jgi:hypothetical protein